MTTVEEILTRYPTMEVYWESDEYWNEIELCLGAEYVRRNRYKKRAPWSEGDLAGYIRQSKHSGIIRAMSSAARFPKRDMASTETLMHREAVTSDECPSCKNYVGKCPYCHRKRPDTMDPDLAKTSAGRFVT